MNRPLPLEGKGEIYLLRHGESEGGRGVMKGRLDRPLSAAGLKQAEAAGAWLKGRGLDLILTSPLQRALLTARAVARVIGLADVRPSPRLTEFDIGIFTGLTLEEARVKDPAAHAAFLRDGWDAVSGAEKCDSCFERSAALWKELADCVASGQRRLLCVGHKGIFQWVLRASFGCRSPQPLFEIDAGGLYRLSFNVSETSNYFIWDILNFVPWKTGIPEGR